jgi:flagellar protein FliJ
MDSRKLARIHRVRSLQLGLAQSEELRIRDIAASEASLSHRIAQLAAAVAPAPRADGAVTLAAAAHYRDRLHRSAESATNRVRAAEAEAARAAEATRSAKRDQSAVEKLLARAEADAALRAIRALQDAPPVRKIRHDPC